MFHLCTSVSSTVKRTVLPSFFSILFLLSGLPPDAAVRVGTALKIFIIKANAEIDQ
ncbi:MAG: hypothetical protein IJD64_00055 [Clostridia bacterium]|nr:hypothetical protein [Clostridia bacterium]